METIRFYSTNRKSEEVNLSQALITGQAPDKGLYMPTVIPKITDQEILTLRNKTYPEIAEFILGKYTGDTFSPQQLQDLCYDAYNYEVPLEHVTKRQYVMRLDQGPTASFKDFAARMMARMFGTLRKDQQEDLVILTATSGDTGSAVANAFYEIPHIKVMVLFPPKEVSTRQRKQMTTLGQNISIVGVDGKFDDCQTLVKQAFSDSTLQMIKLTSANSINIGRLLPQIVYYVYGYIRLAEKLEPLTISIPSGNFGNMMGALLAKKMGLPIKRLIIATNENDEVPVYLKSNHYQKIVPSRVCISNAMNVGHPSNFARVVDLYGGWMDETGAIKRQPDISKMRQELWSISINDKVTRKTIKEAWQKYGLLLEPHGAVGWAGLEHFVQQENEEGLMVSVETAHPAKFPEEIEDLLGLIPEIPESLAHLDQKKESYSEIENDYSAFHKLLVERYTS